MDVFSDVAEWLFVERCFGPRHLPAEVHDPLAGRPARHIHAVGPRLQHVRVRSSVGVGWKAQPSVGKFARRIERAALGVAHERHAHVLRQALGLREIEAGTTTSRREIGMDRVHGLAIEHCWRMFEPTAASAPVACEGRMPSPRGCDGSEAHERNAHGSAVNHPRFVRPCIEDRLVYRGGSEGATVCAATDGVRGDKADADRLARR